MKIIESIRNGLMSDLPGFEAQQRAVPGYRKGPEVDFDSLTGARESGVLLLLYPEEDRIYFPLMKRQEYDGTHSGQISLPGGRLEPGDSTLIHTALRETEEEIGVRQKEIEVLGNLTRLFIPPSNYIVLPTVGYMPYKPSFIKDPREVKELFSVSLDELLDDKFFKTTDLTVRNMKVRDIPYYAFNDEIVWGATAMILSEFRQLLLRY